MRCPTIVPALALLGGCATAVTNGTARSFPDRKYNTHYPLRAAAVDPRPLQTAPRHDRKYNTVLPARRNTTEAL